ncbi:ABC transporter ATP-binding protein [Vibrio comitans]|uniref:ABC transporter ATP-binding protein n=1 Tax=Vibrio comitans NBRC 102076 TaxID=1219078 RepID=A0A4Y3IJF4_9VIBR|nr:ABC transporter ATP-binding protein [Vibrio comitans]GEA59142.1 ABC transporter ATP-binding protein [Vibrio comitans NBRC 102076]
MLNPVVVAQSLCVKFGNNNVLDDVSFTVNQGEVFALLGGNGAGKSTTLKTFLGTVAPSAGSASVMGHVVGENNDAIRNKIAYLPESVMLYGHMTGLENVEYFLSLSGLERSRTNVEDALNRVALQPDAWHKKLSEYSKGMRQKTAIALALLREAPVLFLDEPTSGLDPSAIDEFNQLVTALANSGSTIFMVTHDVYGACQVAHRIGLLDNGKVVGVFERNGGELIDTEEVHTAFAKRNA